MRRAAWARLEALALTTNARLLRSVRALVLDEPDALLQPPHPNAPLAVHALSRHHPRPAQMLLQRVLAVQHRMDEVRV